MPTEVTADSQPIDGEAAVVAPAVFLDETLAFFIDKLGFRLDSIFPADAPREAVISGFGLCIHFCDIEDTRNAPSLRLKTPRADLLEAGMLRSPNGMQVYFDSIDTERALPPVRQSAVVQRFNDAESWHVGRAGMLYRDLIPGRQGGRYIASHIRIPDAGPVPDLVHYHKVRFQMIYCYRGWVKLVYEDQGPPFIMSAGDCVLQPPEIRHRVLESSAGLEVIELGAPADHLTVMDHSIQLPTGRTDPQRRFGGQLFVHHQANGSEWHADDWPDFLCRDTGIAAATDGLAGVSVLKATAATETAWCAHGMKFYFVFVLEGRCQLQRDGRQPIALSAGDCFVIPKSMSYRLAGCAAETSFLRVTSPALKQKE